MFKSNFTGIFLAVYCHLSLHFPMSIIVDKWKINIYNWTKHTYLWGLDWIKKTHWSPNFQAVFMFLLLLEDASSASGLKTSWHCFLSLLCFCKALPGRSDCLLRINEHGIDPVMELMEFPFLSFFYSAQSFCSRAFKLQCSSKFLLHIKVRN